MSVTKIKFGEKNNKDVYLYTLSNTSGMTVKATNLGCQILQMNVQDREGVLSDVVLGFDNF